MTLETIKKSIDTLQPHYAAIVSPPSLQERIRVAYYQKMLPALAKIFEENAGNTAEEKSKLANALEAFLRENWSLVNGTLLSYTALPTHETTLLLCEALSSAKCNSELNPIKS